MVQCSAVSSLLCKTNDDMVNFYCLRNLADYWKRKLITDDLDRRRRVRLTRKKYATYLLILIVLVSIPTIIIFHATRNTRKATYSRSQDQTLLHLVEQSPAAAKLPKKGQLFCWVQTSPLYHDTRAIAINETWMHRCDHGQLFTSHHFNDSSIPYSTVFAGIPDNYYNLFFKSRYAFYYTYTYLSKDFEWYMKADDDTYVIVEHLKKYLSTLDPDVPYYLGYVLKPYLKEGYNAGGAGYVLSRAALKIFSERLYANEELCPDDIYEDVGIGRCLANVGITPTDTRNAKKQNRFNTFTPFEMFKKNKWDLDWVKYPELEGYEAIPKDLISFHHLSADELRLFEILLYRVDRP